MPQVSFRDSSPVAALQRAVEALGSQAALGRLVGVAQPSVWKWLNKSQSLPAEHVLKVEEATGISRHELRPDIYPLEPSDESAVADRYNGVRA